MKCPVGQYGIFAKSCKDLPQYGVCHPSLGLRKHIFDYLHASPCKITLELNIIFENSVTFSILLKLNFYKTIVVIYQFKFPKAKSYFISRFEITQYSSFTGCRIFVIPLFETYFKVSMIVQISLAFLVLYETPIFVTILTNVVKYLILVGKIQVVQYKQLVSILQDLSRVRVHQNMVAMEF